MLIQTEPYPAGNGGYLMKTSEPAMAHKDTSQIHEESKRYPRFEALSAFHCGFLLAYRPFDVLVKFQKAFQRLDFHLKPARASEGFAEASLGLGLTDPLALCWRFFFFSSTFSRSRDLAVS